MLVHVLLMLSIRKVHNCLYIYTLDNLHDFQRKIFTKRMIGSLYAWCTVHGIHLMSATVSIYGMINHIIVYSWCLSITTIWNRRSSWEVLRITSSTSFSAYMHTLHWSCSWSQNTSDASFFTPFYLFSWRKQNRHINNIVTHHMTYSNINTAFSA